MRLRPCYSRAASLTRPRAALARAPRRWTRATRRRRRRKGGVAFQTAVDINKVLARAEDVTYGETTGAARGHHHSDGRGRDDGRSDGLQQSTKTDEQDFGRYRALSSGSSRGRGSRRFSSTSRTRRRSTRSSSSNSCTGHRSSNHRGEFDQRNFLEKHRKIDSIETLLLVNVRLIKQMSEEGRDVVGIIDHMELLIEKSIN